MKLNAEKPTRPPEEPPYSPPKDPPTVFPPEIEPAPSKEEPGLPPEYPLIPENPDL